MPGEIYLLLQQEIFELDTITELVNGFRQVKRIKDGFDIYSVTSDGLQAMDYDEAKYLLAHTVIAEGVSVVEDEYGLVLIEPRANSDNQPIEPSQANKAMQAQSALTTPMGESSQLVGVNPAMTAPSEDVMGSIEPMTNHQDMNPLGVPKMMGAGAVSFDIKDLIHTNMLDCGKLISITNTGTEGTIIAQIPYNPLDATYFNPYITSWVKLHERYEGALMVRVTMIGNPMYSSAIGVAWMPYKVAGTTISITEAQKYSYTMHGSTVPFNKEYILHDARKDRFYRTTDETDFDNRPHLVIFLGMAIQNPFNEAAVLRFRIATRLSNPRDTANFFKVSNPIVTPPENLGINSGLVQGNLKLFFKQIYTQQMFIYTDGNNLAQQMVKRGYVNPVFSKNMQLQAGNSLMWSDKLNGPQYSTDKMIPPPEIVYKRADTRQFEGWLDENYNVGTIGMHFMVPNLFRQQFLMQWNRRWWLDLNNPLINNLEALEDAILQKIEQLFQPNNFYDNVQFRIKPLCVWRYVAPGTNYGGYKILTDYGIIWINATKSQTYSDNSHMPNGAGEAVGAPDEAAQTGQWSQINYENIDTVLLKIWPENVTQLGPDAAVLRITSQLPSAVLGSFNAPTARDDPIVLAYAAQVAANLGPDEFLRFYFSDAQTSRVVCVAQYNKAANTFVIAQNSSVRNFAVLNVSMDTLNVDVRIEKQFVTLPYTSTESWVPRTSETFKEEKTLPEPSDISYITRVINECKLMKSKPQPNMTQNKTKYWFLQPVSKTIQPNAMIAAQMAGGAMSGIGQSLQHAMDQKYNAAESQKDRDFAANQGTLHRDFMKELNDTNWLQRGRMQEKQYGHERYMQATQVNNEAYMLGIKTPVNQVVNGVTQNSTYV